MVTVGAQLPMKVAENFVIGCPDSCAVTNPVAPGGASDVSRVDGVILRWRLYRGSAPTPGFEHPGYRLRVLTPVAGGYLGAGTSSLSVPAGVGTVETFSTFLSVKAGQLIALEAENGDSDIRFGFSDAASSVFLEPTIADGETGTDNPAWEDGYLFPFNAEILPPPQIDRVSPSGGSFATSTKVTVTGQNFAEVTSVTVGGQAVEFTVDSETQLSAVVPPREQLGSVPVKVVTVAGSVDAATGFRYEGCVVPKLKEKPLSAVRKVLDRRKCRLGEVRMRHGATSKTGRVKRQHPRRGTVLPLAGKVEVALGLDSAKG